MKRISLIPFTILLSLPAVADGRGDSAVRLAPVADRISDAATPTAERLPAAEQESDPVDELKKQLGRLKITGYLQAEYIEDDRSTDVVGGNRDEFRVRRGRVKFTYQAHPSARFVIQPDFSSSGVSLKDAYIELYESTTGWNHTLTAGQFALPFGQEITLSSSRREVPERSRVIRTLFPGERDRGATVSGTVPAGWFNYTVGLVNGSGVDERRDTDSEKDLIGRLGFELGQFIFGISGYVGEELVATSSQPAGVWFDKERQGVDLEWATPVEGLRVRAEYVEGEELGAEVNGWYVYLIQDFLDRHRIAVRVDEYDPGRLRPSVQTVVGAYTYDLTRNTILMLAYEHPDIEGTNIDHDVTTVRLQYKF